MPPRHSPNPLGAADTSLTGNDSVHKLSIHDLCTTNSEISNHTEIEHVYPVYTDLAAILRRRATWQIFQGLVQPRFINFDSFDRPL